MTNPIDLSKYTKGRRLRCVNGQCPTLLTDGKVYESLGPNTKPESEAVFVTADDGRPHSFWFSRFVPVEDEALAPVESPWREIDRNETHVLYQASCAGTVQCIGTLGFSEKHLTSPSEVNPCYRAKLGRRGFRYTNDGDFSNAYKSGDYRAREGESAPPVAASTKVDHNAKCSCGKPFHKHDGIGGNRCNACGERVWDSSKYNGLDAPTYQQLSTLDKRIAVARAELDLGTAERVKRMAGPGFPHEGHSDRVTGYRRWGQS